MTQNVRAGGYELNQVTHNMHIMLQYAFNGEITPVLKLRFFHGNLLFVDIGSGSKEFCMTVFVCGSHDSKAVNHSYMYLY